MIHKLYHKTYGGDPYFVLSNSKKKKKKKKKKIVYFRCSKTSF